MRARQQHLLHAETDVPDTACDGSALVVYAPERDGHLELRPDAEPTLVDELAADVRCVVRVESGRDRSLALRERFLGGQRSRQVQLAAWPAGIAAQGPQVTHDGGDLGGGEWLLEGGHDAREPAAAATLADRGFPVDVQLGRRRGTVAEIRKGGGFVKSDRRIRRAFAVGTVTPGASRPEDCFAAREPARARLVC